MSYESISKKSKLEDISDSGAWEDSDISTAFNDGMLGEPMTGLKAEAIRKNKKKYDIFGSKGVGSHFGRSGSPTNNSSGHQED